MKGIVPLLAGAIVLIALIAATGFLKPGSFGLEEAVWCNVLEYQTCYMAKSFTGTINVIQPSLFLSREKDFTCGYDECRLTVILSQASGTTLTVNNVQISIPYTMKYSDLLEATFGEAQITYDAYNRRLDWCGASPCTNGIQVAGSDKCTFITDKSIYGQTGQLLRSPTAAGQSYTVATGSSIQLPGGQQFICGTKFNQCTTDTDCVAGHTFTYNGLGAEVSAGSLQIYGCILGGTAPTTEQKDVTQQEKNSITSASFNYGNRCQIKTTQTVQCTPGTTACGSNAVCDVKSFTCQQTGTVKCAQDRDCGFGTVYDQPTKSYYNYVCRNPNTLTSFCDRNLIKTVACAYNSECPVNSYCGTDNTCKQTTNPKSTCLTACCVGDVRYFDKPAPVGNVCCPGGTDYAITLQQCSAKPPVETDIFKLIGRFIAALIIAGIILIILILIGNFFPPLRIITMSLMNPAGFIIGTLIIGLMLFLFAGGLAASLVGIT